MLEGYIGDWIEENREVSVDEITDTCLAIIDDPMEFNFSLEDIYDEVEKRGLNRFDISHLVLLKYRGFAEA